jgi:hypothetical protein
MTISMSARRRFRQVAAPAHFQAIIILPLNQAFSPPIYISSPAPGCKAGRLAEAEIPVCVACHIVSRCRGAIMLLLFDPYAHPLWSISDVRVVNKVADAVVSANEDIDLAELSFAIRSVYRPGMKAQALMVHVNALLRRSPPARSAA